MSSRQPLVHIRARFDGRVFVPEEPVQLPLGTVLDGWTLPIIDAWPPGFIARTMGAWDGEDLPEPFDPPLASEELISDETA